MDFDFVTPRLATGAEVTSPADVDALLVAGLTHIIDRRDGFTSAHLLADEPRIAYLWNGCQMTVTRLPTVMRGSRSRSPSPCRPSRSPDAEPNRESLAVVDGRFGSRVTTA